MHTSRLHSFVDFCCLFVLSCSLAPLGAMAADELEPLTGTELFHRRWQVNDPYCAGGDGVGPVFNDTSCVGCHHQGAVGGGGDNEHNVDLLTLRTPPEDLAAAARRDRRTPLRVHPDFLANRATIVLHKFGTSSDYEFYRFRLLGREYAREMSAVDRARFWAQVAKSERRSPAVQSFTVQGLQFQLSQRNTPALFGAGLIDMLSTTDIEAMAAAQSAGHGGVEGRVAVANPRFRDATGRFGWRGQTASLEEFVLGACANEVGLACSNHSQAIDPLFPDAKQRGADLDEDQCEKLVAFVRGLPRPVQIKPTEPNALLEVERGEALFHRIGCGVCHAATVGPIDGLYSDLLLHDMGRELADPVPALPQMEVVGHRSVDFGYFGGIVDILAEVDTETRQEWRTPPLWGVADSAPYLHDGRAANLAQAVLLHGGEGAGAKENFTLLTGAEQKSLIAFLRSLRAPL